MFVCRSNKLSYDDFQMELNSVFARKEFTTIMKRYKKESKQTMVSVNKRFQTVTVTHAIVFRFRFQRNEVIA